MTPSRVRRSTAVARRDGHHAPEIRVLTEPKGSNFPAGRMLIASPLAINDVVSRIPRGRVLSVRVLRDTMARRFAADYTCPITAGIFLRIAADAAEEERLDGADDVMPWWRVVRDDGALIDKLPGGVRHQADLLTEEDVAIALTRGVPRRVADLASHQWTPRSRGAT
jgi:hypothetical protein